uniref:Uncharacterized protein n=1 Tax=Panagrellus redivivus TaxID=6233 RepID=A0A7E4UV91_PANRE
MKQWHPPSSMARPVDTNDDHRVLGLEFGVEREFLEGVESIVDVEQLLLEGTDFTILGAGADDAVEGNGK